MPKPTLQGRIALDWSSVDRAMKGTQKSVRAFVDHFGRGLYDVGVRTQRLAVYAGTAAAAFTAFGLRAAGQLENLRLRLDTAMGDPKRGARAWAETWKFAVASPLELEPLVRARTLLENVGLTGIASLKSVSNAAVVLGRDVEDVASALASMETEPLRRMGITSRSRSVKTKNGDMVTRFTMGYRDRNQIQHKVKVTGIEDARRAILSIFNVKYAGGMDRFAKSWTGVWSTFKDSVKIADAQVHETLKNRLVPVLGMVNDALGRMLENGTFIRLGNRLYGWANYAIKSGWAMINSWNHVARSVREDLNNLLIAVGAFVIAWKTGLVEIMLKGLGYLVVSSKAAFLSMASMFTGLSAFFIGFKIGRAIEESFGLSTLVAKYSATIQKVIEVFVAGNLNMLSIAREAGKGIWAAITGNDIGDKMAGKAIGGIVQSMYEQYNPKQIIADLKQAYADIDAVSGDVPEGIGAKFEALKRKLGEEFLTWEGWLKDIEKLLPDSIKKLIAQLKAEFAALPNIAEKTGAPQFADKMKDAADSAEKLAKLEAPLRGFFRGPLGHRNQLGFGGGGAAWHPPYTNGYTVPSGLWTGEAMMRRNARGMAGMMDASQKYWWTQPGPAVSPAGAVVPFRQTPGRPTKASAGFSSTGIEGIYPLLKEGNDIQRKILQAKATFNFAQ